MGYELWVKSIALWVIDYEIYELVVRSCGLRARSVGCGLGVMG